VRPCGRQAYETDPVKSTGPAILMNCQRATDKNTQRPLSKALCA
jgi:hypothetical protein